MAEEKFSTRIPAYLQILAGFDTKKVSEVENELIAALEKAGLSKHRYQRYKNDREGKVQLLYTEVLTILKHFKSAFEDAKQNATDEAYLSTLEKWTPKEPVDIYWQATVTSA